MSTEREPTFHEGVEKTHTISGDVIGARFNNERTIRDAELVDRVAYPKGAAGEGIRPDEKQATQRALSEKLSRRLVAEKSNTWNLSESYLLNPDIPLEDIVNTITLARAQAEAGLSSYDLLKGKAAEGKVERQESEIADLRAQLEALPKQ